MMKSTLALIPAVLLVGCTSMPMVEKETRNFTFTLVTPGGDVESEAMLNGIDEMVTEEIVMSLPDGKQLTVVDPRYSVIMHSLIEYKDTNQHLNHVLLGAGEIDDFTFVFRSGECHYSMNIELSTSQYDLCGFKVHVEEVN